MVDATYLTKEYQEKVREILRADLEDHYGKDVSDSIVIDEHVSFETEVDHFGYNNYYIKITITEPRDVFDVLGGDEFWVKNFRLRNMNKFPNIGVDFRIHLHTRYWDIVTS